MALNGTKSKSEIYSLLTPLSTAVLSTVSSEGKPHAAVIYFIADEDLNVYFLTKSDTTKSHNVEENKHAALTVIFPNSPQTIQATGSVAEIEEATMYTKIMGKISEENAKGNSFYWPPPLSRLDSSGDLVLYKFIPDWLRYADFAEEKNGSVFYDVIPVVT